MSDQLALFIDFTNIAIWAEAQFFDLDLNRMMEYLQSRGPVVVKRAYGDWRRFLKYRDDLLDNSVDLPRFWGATRYGLQYHVPAGRTPPAPEIRTALRAWGIKGRQCCQVRQSITADRALARCLFHVFPIGRCHRTTTKRGRVRELSC